MMHEFAIAYQISMIEAAKSAAMDKRKDAHKEAQDGAREH